MLTSTGVRWWPSIANVSELRTICRKVDLHSRGGDKDKIFRVRAVKSYRSEVTATLVFKLGGR